LAGILGEGVRLMLAGMGVVFVLLTLLVLAVKGMSRLALAVGPPVPVPDASGASGVAGNGTELIAAISAAVAAYRRDAR
jgi:oxaloacetate decarboxylase gamma subunit